MYNIIIHKKFSKKSLKIFQKNYKKLKKKKQFFFLSRYRKNIINQYINDIKDL